MRAHGLSLIGEWAYLNGPKMANRLLRSNLKTRFVRLVVRLDAGVASYVFFCFCFCFLFCFLFFFLFLFFVF